MRNPTLPLEIVHVTETVGVTSDRPRKEVRVRDTETGKDFHVDFEYVRATRGEGITISEGDVESGDYWEIVGYGGAGDSEERGQLARVAMIQLAVDHLRTHDDITIKFAPSNMTPTNTQEEPTYVWFHSSRGSKVHLAPKRDSTSLCGQIDVGWPNPVDDEFDVDSYTVCKRCRAAYRDREADE